MFVSAIIAAGGRGARRGADAPKQLLEIGGRPMLQRTVETFLRAACVHEIVVALPPDLASDPPGYLRGPSKPLHIVPGGARRQDSVAAAFARVSAEAEVVVVHDAARPFVTEGLVERTIEAARMAGAAIAAVPVRDTVKEIALRAGADEVQTVARTLPRDRIVLAQTPQAFRRDVLEAALAFARRNGVEVTDEAALVEQTGHSVRLVPGELQNVKITTPDDLRAARDAAGPGVMRVGTGYDLHRLAAGRPFVLAGVTIASPVGPVGHSDADVLCHAITDALLGAAARGDIGSHFPDTDERWRGAAGLDLLSRAVEIVRADGLAVVNVDAVVIAERPRLAPHASAIRANLALTLGVEASVVSVKGKTNEGIGEIGKGEAIACHAIAMIAMSNEQ
jgi:2-C-methyl-D-erythritol 4-phosphate cytidylyltransferase/2-C-methyl-D-erythritol 2,4-cyclodiphosphate synthase